MENTTLLIPLCQLCLLQICCVGSPLPASTCHEAVKHHAAKLARDYRPDGQHCPALSFLSAPCGQPTRNALPLFLRAVKLIPIKPAFQKQSSCWEQHLVSISLPSIPQICTTKSLSVTAEVPRQFPSPSDFQATQKSYSYTEIPLHLLCVQANFYLLTEHR